jgi:hypothetical protein
MSVRLAESLLSKNTYATGTIKTNRSVPQELNETQLRPHQSCFIRNKDLLLVKLEIKEMYTFYKQLECFFCRKISTE